MCALPFAVLSGRGRMPDESFSKGFPISGRTTLEQRPSLVSTSFRCASSHADKLQDPEFELYRNIWRQNKLFPPFSSRVHGRNLRNWSYFLFVLALYEMIAIPLQLAVEEPKLPDGSLPAASAADVAVPDRFALHGGHCDPIPHHVHLQRRGGQRAQ